MPDNICKTEDDFPALAEKVKEASALVVGGYSPYSVLDAFTKAFLERMWSLRHVNVLSRDKLVIAVVTALAPPIADMVAQMLTREMVMDKMDVLGTVKIKGNVPCLTCGKGDVCEMSGARAMFGPDVQPSADQCVAVEDQNEVMAEAGRLAGIMAERLQE